MVTARRLREDPRLRPRQAGRAAPPMQRRRRRRRRSRADDRAGHGVGTVGYMSPEQAPAAPSTTAPIFLVRLHPVREGAAGGRAFSGTSAIDTLHQIIHTDPAPLSQRAPATSVELQRVIQKCLQKDPEDRYQSMKELTVDLRSLRRQLDGGSSSAVPVQTPAARWSPRAFAAIAIAALAFAAAGAWLVRRAAAPAGIATAVTLQRVTDTGTVVDAVIHPTASPLAYR